MITLKIHTKKVQETIARMIELKKAIPANMWKLLFTYRNKMALSSQQEFLSVRSPKTLGVVTGRLRSSIQGGSTIEKEDDNNMYIILGTNVIYAPHWEYGFTGTVNIPGHSRRISSRNIRSKGKLLAKGVAFVNAHTREVKDDARPFLRPAMEKYIPGLKADLGNWKNYEP